MYNDVRLVFLPFDLCIFRKYFVPFSPSWYHWDFILVLMCSPISFNILSRLQITSSSLSIAVFLKESVVAVSKADCQKLTSFLRLFIFSSLVFLRFVAISIASDLIDIFRYSNF